MANRDVHDFFELRQGLEGMAEFAAAALRLLDKQGIAMGAARRARPPLNGNGNGHIDAEVVRERVKQTYTSHKAKRAVSATPTNGRLTNAQLIRENRARSAALLDALDPVEPRPLPPGFDPRMIGALTRRGYVKQKGKGRYLRTAKPFSLNKRAPVTPAPGATQITAKEAASILGVSDSRVRQLANEKKLHFELAPHAKRADLEPVLRPLLHRAEVEQLAAQRAGEA